jgi:hypothetical protein
MEETETRSQRDGRIAAEQDRGVEHRKPSDHDSYQRAWDVGEEAEWVAAYWATLGDA